jgi:TolA-binding protein
MNNIRIIAVVFLLFLFGCGRSPEALNTAGEEHLAAGEYSLALEQFQEIMTSHPEDSLAPRAGYQVARIYLDNLGDYARGYEALREVVTRFPGSGPARQAQRDLDGFTNWLFEKAEARRNKKQINESLEILQYVVDAYSDQDLAPRAQYLIGDIYINDLRDFQQAIEAYRKVITNFPGSQKEAHARFMIGYIYANVLNDLEKAREEYQAFLTQYPDHELAPSVKFELDNLGKDINEIPVLKHITGESSSI